MQCIEVMIFLLLLLLHNTGHLGENRATRERHIRQRRAAVTHTIEMTIVADYADFAR